MIKIKFFFLLIAVAIIENSKAQSVAINTDGSTADASAALDIKSIDKGMLVPRMTSAQRTIIVNPATGLLVFDITTGSFWFKGSSGWTELVNNNSTDKWSDAPNGIDIYRPFFSRVGINRNIPNYPLDVDGASFDGGIVARFNNPITTVGERTSILLHTGTQNGNQGAAAISSIASVTGGQHLAFTTVPSGIQTASPAFERMRIDSAGNVGIGVTNPFSKLTVNGDAAITSNLPTLRFFRNPSAGGSRIMFQLNDSTNEFAITHTLNRLYFSRGGGILGFFSDLVIANNGNVGIGTGTPAVKLHISGSQTDLLRLETTDVAVNPQLSFANSGALKAVIRLGGDDMVLGSPASNNTGKFILRLNGGDRFTVQPDGKVLIGTSTSAAGYMLNVNGKAICTELKVQLQANWPDYVFKEDYKLKSFNELRNYIAANNHLPGMPAASEIQNSGMEVGEMQRKMMEKIEELTLYVLQLENKISTLEKLKRPSE